MIGAVRRSTRRADWPVLVVAAVAILVTSGCTPGPSPNAPGVSAPSTAPPAAAATNAEKSLLPLGALDVPTTGAKVSSTFVVTGWAFSEDGIRKIDVYIDRRLLASTTPSILRPDVQKAVPAVGQATQLGWTLQAVSGISDGKPHELVVQAISNKGVCRDIGHTLVTIAN